MLYNILFIFLEILINPPLLSDFLETSSVLYYNKTSINLIIYGFFKYYTRERVPVYKGII